jgi:hypothetical protein
MSTLAPDRGDRNSLAYVYDGQQCLGHVLARGRTGWIPGGTERTALTSRLRCKPKPLARSAAQVPESFPARPDVLVCSSAFLSEGTPVWAAISWRAKSMESPRS